MMTYIIASAIAVLSILMWYLSRCLALVKTAHYRMVMDISGQKPDSHLTNGWHLILWPFRRLGMTISRQEFQYDLPKTELSVKVHDFLKEANRQDALGKVEIPDKAISLGFEIYFWNPRTQRTRIQYFLSKARPADLAQRDPLSLYRQYSRFFELCVTPQTGEMDISRLRDERLKDFLQHAFVEKAKAKHMDLYKTIDFPEATIDTIREELQAYCLINNLPIRILNLHRNKRFEPEPALAKSMSDRAEAAITLETDLVQAEADRRVAELKVAVAKAEGEQLKAKLAAVAEAYGLNGLPEARKVQGLLDVRALEVYEMISRGESSKVVIMPDMIGQIGKIGSALAAVAAGGTE